MGHAHQQIRPVGSERNGLDALEAGCGRTDFLAGGQVPYAELPDGVNRQNLLPIGREQAGARP